MHRAPLTAAIVGVRGLRASALDAGRVALSWSTPREHGFAGVLIRRAPGAVAPTASGGIAVAHLGARAHAYLDAAVVPGRTYSYAVFARNAAGRLSKAAIATVRVPAAPRPTRQTTRHATSGSLPNDEIAGTVTGEGTPLGGVDVSVYTAAGDYVMDSYTASDGTYGVDPLPTLAHVSPAVGQEYVVCFDARNATGGTEASGYAAECYDNQPWNYGTIPSGVTLVAPTENTTTEVDADLSAGGGITGSVRSAADGSNLANGYVQIYDTDNNYVDGTSTGGNGHYTVTGLQPGTYYLCVDGSGVTRGAAPYGYLSVCYKNKPFDGYDVPPGSTPVTVSAGAIDARVNLRLPAAGAISGTVLETGGAPLQNYDIDVFDPQGNQIYPQVTENSDGTYQVTGVAPGQGYVVCFTAQNATGGTSSVGYLPQCYDGVPWDYSGSPPTDATQIGVGAGADTTEIDATLDPASAIAGSVTSSATEQGIRDVDVEVLTASGDYVTDVYTASNGSYHALGLPPSAHGYLVCFGTYAARGGGSTTGYLPECYDNVPWDGGSTPVGATQVPVDPGATATVDAQLDPAGAIAGKVTAASGGAGLANVDVLVFDGEGNSIAEAFTSGTGNYRVLGLSPTATGYTVCFDASQATGGPSAGGYRSQCYRQQPWDGQYYDLPTGATPVTVPIGGTHPTVNARLASGGAIAGAVTAADDGSGLENVEVDAYKANGDYVAGTFTNPDGTYRIAGLSTYSSYRVCFSAYSASGGPSSAGYLDQCYLNKPASDPQHATPVAVTAGAVTSSIDASLSDAGAVSGVVTSAATGKAIAGVEIDAIDATDNIVGATYTNASGHYLLGGLPSNAAGYSVCFDASSAHGGGVASGYLDQCYANVPWDGYSDPTGTATPVPVTAGSVSGSIDAALGSAGGIAGKVTAISGGAGLAGVDVIVQTSDGDYLVDTATGSDGSYRITGLPPSTTGYYVCFDATNATGGTSTTGYVSQCYNNQPWTGGLPPAGATLVTVGAGSMRTGINARLKAGAAISGAVTAAGAPVGDAYAVVFAGSQEVTSVGTSGVDGSYQVLGLAPGTYQVCFDAYGADGAPELGYADECWQDVPWDGNYGAVPAAAGSIVLHTGSSKSGVDASLGTAGAISGQINSAVTGNGLYGEAVVYDSNGIATIAGADGGNYQAIGLNPATGPYTVCFDSRDDNTGSSTGYAPQCYDGVAWDGGSGLPAGTTGVSVTAGATTSGIDAALTRGGAISGKVTDAATGDPVPGLFPTVYDLSGNKVGQAYTRASGTYRVNGLAPGKYVVCFAVDSSEYQAQCWNDVAWDNSPNDIPSDATQVNVAVGGVRTKINAELSAPPE